MLGSDDMALNFIHFLSFFESPFRLLDEFANIRYWTTNLPTSSSLGNYQDSSVLCRYTLVHNLLIVHKIVLSVKKMWVK